MSKIHIFGVKLRQVAQLLSVADENIDDSIQPLSNAHGSDIDQKQSSGSGKQGPRAQRFPIPATSTNGFLEEPGCWIGRYKLVSILGEGGMG
ncbi:MAG: hypothetical protein ACYS3S_12745, partial [Planctomycetota bacterium]